MASAGPGSRSEIARITVTRAIRSGTRASSQDASVRLETSGSARYSKSGRRRCHERCCGGRDVTRPLVAVPPPQLGTDSVGYQPGGTPG